MHVIRESLGETEQKLYDGIARIMRNDWKSMADVTDATYRYCLDELFRFALADNSFVAIAQHMCTLAERSTGSPSQTNDHLELAQTIRKLKTKLMPSKEWAAV